MTNKEILIKAINKAIANGFNWDNPNYTPLNSFDSLYDESIIFSHSFAKAFWGEEDEPEREELYSDRKFYHWQYHLQQMVLEEEPLKYLEKFLQ